MQFGGKLFFLLAKHIADGESKSFHMSFYIAVIILGAFVNIKKAWCETGAHSKTTREIISHQDIAAELESFQCQFTGFFLVINAYIFIAQVHFAYNAVGEGRSATGKKSFIRIEEIDREVDMRGIDLGAFNIAAVHNDQEVGLNSKTFID